MQQDPSTYGFSGMQGSCLYPDDEWSYDSSIQLRQVHTDDTCLLRPESYSQLSSQHLTVAEQERSSKALVSDWHFSFPDSHGVVPFYPDAVCGDLRRSISPDETDRSEASIIDHASYTWTQFPVDPPSPEQLSVSSYTNSLSYMQNCTLAPMSSSFTRESSDMHSTSFPAAYVSPTIISAPPLGLIHVGENYTEISEFEREQLVSPFPSDIPHHDSRASICEADLSDQYDDDRVSQMITPPASNSESPIEEDEDSDYRPDHTRMSRRGTQAARASTSQVLRASRASRVSKNITHRVNGSHSNRGGRTNHGIRPNGHTHDETSAEGADNKHKIFTCPLQPYGCTSTCASKNEWKRHITSQHILLDTWRCDLCPVEESEKKIFNRRDLFTQHLRRMHRSCGDLVSHQGDCAVTTDKPGMKPRRKSGAGRASDKAGNSKGSGSPESDPALEARLKDIQDRCCFRIRNPPATYMCAQCEQLFEGPKAQDKWLEHVAHHLSNAQPAIEWERDTHLRSWLLAQGLLETTHKSLRLTNVRNSDSRA